MTIKELSAKIRAQADYMERTGTQVYANKDDYRAIADALDELVRLKQKQRRSAE